MAARLGYVGLGNMGVPIARNLARYAASSGLPPLSFWNRSQAKYDLVRQDAPDAFYATDVEDVVKRSDIVFTSLLNDQAAEDIYGKMFKATEGRNVIFVDQSSVKALTTGKLSAEAQTIGATYIASPVFGRPPAAEAAKLVIVLSGPAEVKDKIRQYLVPALGDRVVDVGEDVKLASALKSIGNSVILGWIELMAESYTLGDAVGLDPSVFNDLLHKLIPAPPLLAYADSVAKGHFPAGGFSVDGGLKDARNMLSLGADLGHPCPLPTIQRAHDNLERAQELGGPNQDWASLSAAVREQAGFTPYREDKGQ
ncbi:hypothetical protein L202_02372 [Cryptococcus amylolentus CBS 6039]|uniref:6-phosphogluconate dehydrogenase NADP-binding domain-containing protein n=1 Tax=Cryptococcus amylolentus CBS 6039 TaxID=1295533 RepID=A0A1E3I233_9TREE|nr:hypothetical protein L202_02372 [Cryptococcus amylolentus CBS 6039]ODN82056.1 hypothetical protein L202_02372 [Cryptococcus amylolentus CBS 6039]